MSSREQTPIHGFEGNNPVKASKDTRKQLPSLVEQLSPIDRPEGDRLQRQPIVGGHRPEVDQRRLPSDTPSESSSAPRRSSSASSLAWDDSSNLSERATGTFLVQPKNATASTQFNVTVGGTEVISVSDEDDIFEEAESKTSTETSRETIRNMASGGADARPAEGEDEELLEATLDLQNVKIGGTVNAKKHFKVIKKAAVTWEDDYQRLNPAQMIQERLTSRLEKAEEFKEQLNDAYLELEELEPEGWSDEVANAVTSLKKKFVVFVQRADRQLHNLQSRQLDPVAQVKAARVKRNATMVVTELEAIQAVLEGQTTVTPDDNSSQFLHQETASAQREKAKSLQEDAMRLITDATDAALPDEAEYIEVALRKMQVADRDLATALVENKARYGFASGAVAQQPSDVPVPKFSGNVNDTDYYTFLADWKQYLNSRYLTQPEQFRTLTKSCLTGQAKNMVKRLEDQTVEAVLSHLKKKFGNPLFLFNSKVEEIKKLGSCTGTEIKRREWLIDVKARMDDLEKLCKDHDLLEKLHNSPIAGDVQGNLNYQALKEFKIIIKKKDPQGNVSAQFFWDSLSSHLDTVIDTLTFEINFSMNSGGGKKNFPNNSGTNDTNVGGNKNRDGKRGSAKVFTANFEEKQGETNEKTEAKQKAKAKKKKTPKDNFTAAEIHISATYVQPALVDCVVCSSDKHTHCFYCPSFRQARGKDRINIAAKMRSCFRCLRMDSNIDFKNKDVWWKNHEKNCQTQWVCQFGKCSGSEKNRQYHFLMCSFHVEENKERDRLFVEDMDQKHVTPGMRFFFNYNLFQLDSQPSRPISNDPRVIPDICTPSIFLLQYVHREGQVLLMFYDGGCGGAALSNRAAEVLQSQVSRPGPTKLNVAGGLTVDIEGGDETFELQLADSEMRATITGLKMPSITTPFPTWDVAGAWAEIMKELVSAFPDHDELPPPPDVIGGVVVDLMLGIRYNKYFPKLLYMLPSGLGIYQSQFEAYEGKTCVLGGSHPSWQHFKNTIGFISPFHFFTAELKAYWHSCVTIQHVYSQPPAGKHSRVTEIDSDADEEDVDEDEDQGHAPQGLDPWDLCDVEEPEPEVEATIEAAQCQFVHCELHRESSDRWVIPKEWDLSQTIYSLREDTNRFLGGELAGSTVTYRCVKCRCCTSCKNSESLEAKSLKEESEQALIESCITYDSAQKRLVSKLPFIASPSQNLLPNRFTAEKIFESQMKRISASEDMKNDVLASFEKLHSRGYVVPVSVLNAETKALVEDEKDAGYFIPWRTVFKQDSLSTPCRIVFDASSRTPGGTSLNDILALGENKLASIHTILLRFCNGRSAFTTDIRLAYNQVALDPQHMRYQKFLWRKDLDPSEHTEPYVINTLIYGVKPVGNCLLAGFSKISAYCKENYPEHAAGAEALERSAYVDDVARADDTAEKSRSTARSLDFTLGLGGMEVKGYTYSGQPPPPEVSSDGETVGVVGLTWTSVADELSLNIKPLFFGKIKRGKLPELVQGDLRESLKRNFTRRNLLGKVAGVFDPLGYATPATSKLKLDLRTLTDLKLGWDEAVPEVYLDTWVGNLINIQKLRDLRFKRSFIPPDAASNDVELIVSADASQSIAVAVVHARVRRVGGGISCRIVTAKSKLTTSLTVPKGELKAAVLATHLAHSVKHSLGDQCKQIFYITDSSIALFWINSDTRPLDTAVRNAVIEIRRFCSPAQWYHVESLLNIADLGTRECLIEAIDKDTPWQVGFPWMSQERADMPIKSIDDIRLSQEESRLASKEAKREDICIAQEIRTDRISDHYKFSNYIVDPCKYGWTRAVRVVSIMIKYIRIRLPNFKPVWEPPVLIEGPSVLMTSKGSLLATHDLEYGERYFFHKATLEVKQFTPAKDLQDVDERNGILYSVGRILEGQEIDSPCNVMIDLSPLTFVKPVISRFSPVAYSIMLFFHENVVAHRSATTTLRESRNKAYILHGRSLANEIKAACNHCRRFKARLVETEMGKIDENRLRIAPAFYIAQVDLFGPLLARCEHNHRSTVKVWGVCFKDPGSGAVSVHAMSKYDTGSFIMAYTRFSSRHGHPRKLLIDSGSQLIAACKSMEISIVDITRQLSVDHAVGVDYEICPVGGHNAHGAVERSIRSIQELFKQVFDGVRMDILALETAFCWVSSQLNDFPICIGNRTAHLDNVDLITPSRLILGRSSTRAAGGYARISPPTQMIESMDQIFRSWWRTWEREKLSDYIPQASKWRSSDPDVRVNDIVMILKNPDEVKLGDPVWRLARVIEVETSHRDGKVRVAICEYKNNSETVFRTTRRSVRKMAVVHHEEELDLVQKLNRASETADLHFSSSPIV